MGLENTGSYIFEYARDDVNFEINELIRKSILETKGFKFNGSNEALSVFYFKVSLSAFSWGEKMEIQTKCNSDGTTTLNILSTSKTGVQGNLVDFGKNRKNIEEFITLLSKNLEKYDKVLIAKESSSTRNQQMNCQNNAIQQIKQLKELLDIGAITNEEFEEKKRELLDKI